MPVTTAAPLNFGRDVQGFNAYAPQPPLINYSATITDGAATSITVPTTYQTWIVSFRYYPNDVWVDTTGAAAIVPVGATLAATTSQLNPASLTLQSGANISIITGQTTCDVGISMWPISYP